MIHRKLKLTPKEDLLNEYSLEKLYRRDVAVVAGGFLAGDRNTIARFHKLYQARFSKLVLDEDKIDDDQVHTFIGSILFAIKLFLDSSCTFDQ